jgi:hypothetical protein
MKPGNKLSLRLTSTGCRSTNLERVSHKRPRECQYCIPRRIEGYVEGNLGIARMGYKIPIHGPWKGVCIIHMPQKHMVFNLFRDGSWAGIHLRSKKEAEELAGTNNIDWKEKTIYWSPKGNVVENKLNIRIKK